MRRHLAAPPSRALRSKCFAPPAGRGKRLARPAGRGPLSFNTTFTTTLTVLALLALPARAIAGDWDLNLGRLCQIRGKNGSTIDCGGGYNVNRTTGVAGVNPDNGSFRSLMSELGVVFAPNILAPAETVGFGGFHFGVEFAWTSINAKKNANTGAKAQSPPHRFWRAAKSVSNTAFSSGNSRSGDALKRIDRELPPSLAPTVTVMARKGFWFPLPSIEFGLGVRHLIGSNMVAGVASAKLALHEGFQGLPLPAVAVRGTGSRVFGTQGFNMTVAGLDFSISKAFGIASTFNLTPYTGYQLLWIIADSEVHDATPGRDQTAISIAGAQNQNDPLTLTRCNETLTNDCNGDFVFLDQPNIIRHRFFIGLRLNLYVATLLFEYSFFAAGGDIVEVKIPGAPVQFEDNSGAQHSFAISLALDY